MVLKKIIKINDLLYSKGIFEQKVYNDTVVISIGNITVGGSGKTPFTVYLAKVLQEENLSVAVVSRGYKGKNRKNAMLVSDYKKILIDSPLYSGDEPFLIAKLLNGVPVAVSKKRKHGIDIIADTIGLPDVILLDDAFSHKSVKKDFDIVLIDGSYNISNERLLPFGHLREPVENLKRSDFIFVKDGIYALKNNSWLRNKGYDFNFFKYKIEGYYNLNFTEVDRPTEAIAFCGIAHPDDFFTKLKEYGISLKEEYPLFDHFSYPKAYKLLLSEKVRKSEFLYITTEKDMVKLTDLPVDIKEKILYTKTKIKTCKTGVDKLVEAVHKRINKKRRS